MLSYVKNLIRENGLVVSIYIVLFVIITNALFTMVYRSLLLENSATKEQVVQAMRSVEGMNTYVNLVDLGLRGYLIEQDDQFLNPLNGGMANYKKNFEDIKSILNSQGYEVSKLEPAFTAIDKYMKLVGEMVQMAKSGNVEEAVSIFKSDPGAKAYAVYNPVKRDVLQFEDDLLLEAETTYSGMSVRMVIAQVLLLLIGIPILMMSIFSIQRSKKNRQELFHRLNDSNKKYIFDAGEDFTDRSDEGIINSLISNLKKATGFISKIANGNYNVAWEGLTPENSPLNKENIAGELTTMRDQMKKVKAEDDIRLWTTQGLSNFADIVRANQQNFKLLAVKLVVNLTKYLDAQQGGLFILNDDNEQDVHLELMGCYAYDRVKTLNRRIEIGQGLVGQCYLEKETVFMTNVPQDFVNITSGLGDARPNSILIVPLKLNDKIEGVIEMASLRKFKSHEIEFVEKLGETIASAITNVRTSENTKLLLERSQQQTEEMRAQEEEMRQNMEELQATQEQMERKNGEVESLLKQASKTEEKLKAQQEIILTEKKNLETENAILSTLMDVIPERVTVKDRLGNYLKVSNSKYKTLKEQGFANVIGKSDKDMFGMEHFEKSHAAEKEIMNNERPVLDMEERIEISKGHKIWGLTSRLPLKDSDGKVLGTVVVTRDITKEKELSVQVDELKSKLKS